jgi:hypothetical protein
MTVDLSKIPAGWFLDELKDQRTRIVYAGDQHAHQGWRCSLQHVSGGRLRVAQSTTPQAAVDECVKMARRGAHEQ